MKNTFLSRRSALALAICTCLGGVSGVYAQSTTGNINGSVPAGGTETVVVESSTGFRRETPVDARGRYALNQIPLGTYTVTLMRDGTVADSRKNVTLRVGASTDVSFASPAATDGADATSLGAVTVTGNSLPSIDVTSVDSRTVITSEQLAKLPLGRSAEAIARLAPGVVNNGGGFASDTGRSVASFGGAAANENAYYVNGFNTTDPLNAVGGLQLPYGAVDQQEVYTGGYSAQYGRSDGGVINQVGKRGTNEWHFGAQVIWEPNWARASGPNLHYTNTPTASPAGDLYQPKSQNDKWTTTVSAYAGGPLIKDKLFFFVAGEFEKQGYRNVNSVGSGTPASTNNYSNPRWYTKLDWNINDSNILELTDAGDKREGSGTRYSYDYANLSRTANIGPVNDTKTGGDLWVAKYTSYITDNLTLSATYGKMSSKNYDQYGGTYDPTLARVDRPERENPALNGGNSIQNNQLADISSPNRGNKSTNLRFDLAYSLGDHTIAVGIDNVRSRIVDFGTQSPGPGYNWTYGFSKDPNIAINDTPGRNFVPAPALFPNGAEGYWVNKSINNNLSNVRSDQRAQYIEDKWQVSDRVLLSLGLRNDQFTDYNPFGEAFIKQTRPQWAPRLGATWDVNGDASFKVYANAGRYYLGLPLSPATGAAAGYIATQQYYTYSGIAADGTPTGLTQMSGVVSGNNSYGIPPDPRTVAAKGLKAENQDEFILGFDKTLGANWSYGAKLTQRKLNAVIDDFCDVELVTAKATAEGHTVGSSNSCYLINGGHSNTFTLIDQAGNPFDTSLSRDEMGMPKTKRRYYSAELYMEHQFDGVWYGKFDYVFSRSYGDTEGQARTDSRQAGAAGSMDWDNSYVMEYSNGILGNDHTHVFKAYGYWQFAPEWQLSGNLQANTGGPKVCLGYYGADETDPKNYGAAYHYCDGKPSPPGSNGRLPWTFELDLGVTYRPEWANQRLAFSANVFNVLNQQRATYRYPTQDESRGTPSSIYNVPLYTQDPRYGRLAVTYDF